MKIDHNGGRVVVTFSDGGVLSFSQIQWDEIVQGILKSRGTTEIAAKAASKGEKTDKILWECKSCGARGGNDFWTEGTLCRECGGHLKRVD